MSSSEERYRHRDKRDKRDRRSKRDKRERRQDRERREKREIQRNEGDSPRRQKRQKKSAIVLNDERQVSMLFKAGSAVFIVFLLGVSLASIFSDGLIYIPSFNAHKYNMGDKVELTVNRIVSEHVPIPFRYSELPVCPVDGAPSIESLGDVILGNRNDVSRAQLKMLEDTNCEVLCSGVDILAPNVNTLINLISKDYRVEWYVDNLPVATKYYLIDTEGDVESNQEKKFTYLSRYPLGMTDEETKEVYFFNHYHFKIYVNEVVQEETDSKPLAFVEEEKKNEYTIVFVEVELKSIDYVDEDVTCRGKNLILKKGEGATVTYTYSTEWISDGTEWTERWNRYLANNANGSEIHWFAILNSTLIVLFLSGIIATILSRTIYRDIDRYNTYDPEMMEETGWKQLSGDVFRPPAKSGLFSVLIGTGIQLGIMAFVTVSFALLGFLSPANRGGVVTALIILFVWLGITAGYFSTWTLRVMKKDKNWAIVRRNSMLTGTFFPGMIFALFFFLNFFLWGAGSISATPFFTLIAVLSLWMFISVPLCLIGSFLSFRRPEIQHPVPVNMIAKGIMDQELYLHPVATFLMGGVLPFGSVFIEFSSILTSIWHQQYYFLFGYLYLVLILLFITCAEVSIVVVYFQLCAEDYRWWWRSYFTGSSSGFYAFCYSIFFFMSTLELTGLVSFILFFGYSLALASIIGAITGTIGFLSAYFFISKIYSEIRAE